MQFKVVFTSLLFLLINYSGYSQEPSAKGNLREEAISPDQMLPLLSHLAAIIRGLGRLGCQSDLPLLDEIKIRQDQFMDLHPDRRYRILVRHVMRLVDASKAAIRSRNS